MLISSAAPIRHPLSPQEGNVALNTCLHRPNGKIPVMLTVALTVQNRRPERSLVEICCYCRQSIVCNGSDNGIPRGAVEGLPEGDVVHVVIFHSGFDEPAHDFWKRHRSRESSSGCFTDDLCIHNWFAERRLMPYEPLPAFVLFALVGSLVFIRLE